MNNYKNIKNEIKSEVQNELITDDDFSDDDVLKIIVQSIERKSHKIFISNEDKKKLRTEIFNSIRKLDVLQSLIDDDSISEIMINGPNNIFIERNGKLYSSGVTFGSEDELNNIIQKIVALANRTVNLSSPIVDARLLDGSRVNVVLSPPSIDGATLTIRKFPNNPLTAEMLIEKGAINSEIEEFLKFIVKNKYNVLVSGSTGCGKTTFLNIMSGYINEDERVITIEDSAELKIRSVKNLVRLETRNANSSGCNEITIRDLIKTALRMRGDRLVIGEVRGEEAIDMLQGMNVGADGSMSTIHANTAADALQRLEVMIMLNKEIPLAAIRRQIASGVDIIIQLGRCSDYSRKLLEIREIIGFENGEIMTKLIYEYVENKGFVKRNELSNIKGKRNS